MCFTYATTSMRRCAIPERINVSLDLLQVCKKTATNQHRCSKLCWLMSSITKTAELNQTLQLCNNIMLSFKIPEVFCR